MQIPSSTKECITEIKKLKYQAFCKLIFIVIKTEHGMVNCYFIQVALSTTEIFSTGILQEITTQSEIYFYMVTAQKYKENYKLCKTVYFNVNRKRRNQTVVVLFYEIYICNLIKYNAESVYYLASVNRFSCHLFYISLFH